MSDSPIEIVHISLLNVAEAFRVAKRIFPGGQRDIAISYFFTQTPKKLLPQASRLFSPIKFITFDYYVAKERSSGKVLGVTGLYAFEKTEAWVGWFGISEEQRGKGLGGAMLDQTIQKAKEDGFDTLRLWTWTKKKYEVALKLYESRGFVRQDLNVADAEEPSEGYVLYSLGLRGQTPKLFEGSPYIALLGESPDAITKGIHLYEKRLQSLQL